MKFKNFFSSASDELLSKEAEKALYERAAAEIESKQIDKGLWAKAFAQSGGDEAKAKASYIELIVDYYKSQLKAEQEYVDSVRREAEAKKREQDRAENAVKKYQEAQKREAEKTEIAKNAYKEKYLKPSDWKERQREIRIERQKRAQEIREKNKQKSQKIREANKAKSEALKKQGSAESKSQGLNPILLIAVLGAVVFIFWFFVYEPDTEYIDFCRDYLEKKYASGDEYSDDLVERVCYRDFPKLTEEFLK